MSSPHLELVLERAAGAGVDLHETGTDRWRGDCVGCGGADRMTVHLDLAGVVWVDCYGAACGAQDRLQALGLTVDDLRPRVDSQPGQLVRRKLSEVPLDPVTFLVPDRVPRRAATFLGGDPGLGKSMWTCLVAAECSRGAYGEPHAVAILNAEDTPAVIRGRVQAAGGDLDLVETLTKGDGDYERVLTLPDDVSHIEEFVVDTNAWLVVIDPLMAFLTDRADANQDHSVRRALANLTLMAERRDVAVLVCAHLNKDEQKAVLYRIGGSIGLVGAARSLLLMAADPDDPAGEAGDRRLLAHAKSNWSKLAPTLRYRQELVELEDDGRFDTTMVLRPDGESDLRASELVGRQRAEGKLETAVEVIVAALSEGPRPSREVKEEVRDEVGCSHATIERAVGQLRATGGLEITHTGKQTYWRIVPVDGSGQPVKSPEQPSQTPAQVALNDDDEGRSGNSGPSFSSAAPKGGSKTRQDNPHHHVGEGDEARVDAGAAARNGRPADLDDARAWIENLAREQRGER